MNDVHLFAQILDALALAETDARALSLTPATREETMALLDRFDFDAPISSEEAIALAIEGLSRHAVQTTHPRYFGLFNPATTTLGVVADALVAAFNPQLATLSHAPFAVLAEAKLLRAFASRFGLHDAEGTFTSGGAEANMTALLVALTRAFPAFAERGARALPGDPVIYISTEGHHSIKKAARMAGLGASAVREIPADARHRMKTDALREAIRRDKREGRAPLLVVATCGSTSGGAIDPIDAVATVAEREGLALHVDAAWGGFAALVPELRPHVQGIERADSITFDAHKALSIPMGAGMFLTKHKGALHEAFHVAASYMPRVSDHDPYAASMQWSRRFTGLKLLLPLTVLGFDGYAQILRRMVAMGDLLRERLAADGWEIANATPLPLVCLGGLAARDLDRIARATAERGAGWVSLTRIGGKRVLRACITNYRTEAGDVLALARALTSARDGAQRTNIIP